MRHDNAFSLIELLLALVVIAALGVLAVVAYTEFVGRARNNQAIADIYLIETLITRFEVQEGELPDNLAETEARDMLDPWDRPYQYINLAGAPKTPSGIPKVYHRQDRNLNPLNTDYDLFSIGKDGQSKKPLTAKHSRDDIVRAGNGAFVGLGADY